MSKREYSVNAGAPEFFARPSAWLTPPTKRVSRWRRFPTTVFLIALWLGLLGIVWAYYFFAAAQRGDWYILIAPAGFSIAVLFFILCLIRP